MEQNYFNKLDAGLSQEHLFSGLGGYDMWIYYLRRMDDERTMDKKQSQ